MLVEAQKNVHGSLSYFWDGEGEDFVKQNSNKYVSYICNAFCRAVNK